MKFLLKGKLMMFHSLVGTLESSWPNLFLATFIFLIAGCGKDNPPSKVQKGFILNPIISTEKQGKTRVKNQHPEKQDGGTDPGKTDKDESGGDGKVGETKETGTGKPDETSKTLPEGKYQRSKLLCIGSSATGGSKPADPVELDINGPTGLKETIEVSGSSFTSTTSNPTTGCTRILTYSITSVKSGSVQLDSGKMVFQDNKKNPCKDSDLEPLKFDTSKIF